MYFNVPIFEEQCLLMICVENLRSTEIKKNVFSFIIKSAVIYFVPIMY